MFLGRSSAAATIAHSYRSLILCSFGTASASSSSPYPSPKQTILHHIERDEWTNVTPSILDRVGMNLHMQPGHPLALLKGRIRQYFQATTPTKADDDAPAKSSSFTWHDHLDPVVTVQDNFDHLLFPATHPGRSRSDSYYLNSRHLLRTHMTANEREILQAGHRSFLVAGDVYRRDEIDATHYPVFHQVEGVRVFDPTLLAASPILPEALWKAIKDQPLQDGQDRELVYWTLVDLYRNLEGLLRHLFGPSTLIRWQPCYFPFTQPSFEAEVLYGDDRWIEVLGAGILQQSILRSVAIPDGSVAWAFGMGLERLAMILYEIPDIRLFWSRDPRFLDQFRVAEGDGDSSLVRFQPFSRFPHIARDLSFWIRQDPFEPNDLFEIIRGIGGDLVENVQLIDSYRQGVRESRCYRITFRSMERSLTDPEVNDLQAEIRRAVADQLDLELR